MQVSSEVDKIMKKYLDPSFSPNKIVPEYSLIYDETKNVQNQNFQAESNYWSNPQNFSGINYLPNKTFSKDPYPDGTIPNSIIEEKPMIYSNSFSDKTKNVYQIEEKYHYIKENSPKKKEFENYDQERNSSYRYDPANLKNSYELKPNLNNYSSLENKNNTYSEIKPVNSSYTDNNNIYNHNYENYPNNNYKIIELNSDFDKKLNFAREESDIAIKKYMDKKEFDNQNISSRATDLWDNKYSKPIRLSSSGSNLISIKKDSTILTSKEENNLKPYNIHEEFKNLKLNSSPKTNYQENKVNYDYTVITQPENKAKNYLSNNFEETNTVPLYKIDSIKDYKHDDYYSKQNKQDDYYRDLLYSSDFDKKFQKSVRYSPKKYEYLSPNEPVKIIDQSIYHSPDKYDYNILEPIKTIDNPKEQYYSPKTETYSTIYPKSDTYYSPKNESFYSHSYNANSYQFNDKIIKDTEFFNNNSKGALHKLFTNEKNENENISNRKKNYENIISGEQKKNGKLSFQNSNKKIIIDEYDPKTIKIIKIVFGSLFGIILLIFLKKLFF